MYIKKIAMVCDEYFWTVVWFGKGGPVKNLLLCFRCGGIVPWTTVILQQWKQCGITGSNVMGRPGFPTEHKEVLTVILAVIGKIGTVLGLERKMDNERVQLKSSSWLLPAHVPSKNLSPLKGRKLFFSLHYIKMKALGGNFSNSADTEGLVFDKLPGMKESTNVTCTLM